MLQTIIMWFGSVCLLLNDNTKFQSKYLDILSQCVVCGSPGIPPMLCRALRSKHCLKINSATAIYPSTRLVFTVKVLKEWMVKLLASEWKLRQRYPLYKKSCIYSKKSFIHLKECLTEIANTSFLKLILLNLKLKSLVFLKFFWQC